MTVDAAIIGGGPAGVAAAISLRQLAPGATVAIFDAGALDQWRPGETLAADADSILESMGVREDNFLEGSATRAAWGSDEPIETTFLFGGSGRRVDHPRLDAILRAHAAAVGVAIHAGSPLTESEGENGDWRLFVNGGECTARFVIDASGRAARFAVDRGVKRLADDRLAGVVVRYAGAPEGDTLVEAQECGYWYSTPTAVALMTDTDMIRDMGLPDAACWNELLAASRWTRERFQGAIAQGPPSIFPAHSQLLSKVGGPGWVAAGDAAMAFDPVSSQGILKALRSGKLAAIVAADYLNDGRESHERYGDLARAEYAVHARMQQEYYGVERRWPEAEFWKRRQAGRYKTDSL